MSYKTNPITNRFKINKGWINANFPENLSFYARDNVFFFKLYLFLKTSFTLRNIKLISCQIRLSQAHVPVLYLVINTTYKRKKKRSTSNFRHLWPTKRAGFKYSPLRNPWNAEALTLMFFDLAKLKKILNARLLPLSKQKPTRFWLTKPRRKTWINFLAKVRKCRTQSIRSRHMKRFHPNHVKLFKYQIQSSLEFRLLRAIKEFRLLTQILKVATLHRNFTTQTLTFYQQRLKILSKSINTIQYVLNPIQQRQKQTKISTSLRRSSKFGRSKFQKKRKLRVYKQRLAKKWLLQFQQKQYKFLSQILKKSRFYETHLDSLKMPLRKALWLRQSHRRNKKKTQRSKVMKISRSKRSKSKEKFRHLRDVNVRPSRFKTSKANQWKKSWAQRIQKKRTVRKIRKLKFFKPWTITKAFKRTKKTKFKFIPNQANLKKYMLQLLTLRLKIAPNFSRPHKQRKKSSRNQLITQLLKKKPRLFRLRKKSAKKRVRPILLQQFQRLRHKKKNSWNLLNRTPITSGIINHYRFKSFQNHQDFHKDIVNGKLLQSFHRQRFDRPNLDDLDKEMENWESFRNRQRLKIQQKVNDINSKRDSIKTYRQSFRMSYKRHLNLLVRYQYKTWLQKVLHLFFQTRFEVKFTQPLTQFKNFKFFRLVYPIPKFRQKRKIKLTTPKRNFYSEEERFLGQRYIYLGTRLNRLKPFKKKVQHLPVANVRSESAGHKKKKHRHTSTKVLNTRKKKHRRTSTKVPDTINLNTYLFKKKADPFKRLRRQKLRAYAQKRLGSIKKQLLMRQFVPILSLFIKYLNPQLLADHIAKEFERTKKHRNILFGLKTALRSLKFARGIGYRIAIVGRINSSTKSRAFYLTKKSLIRQNFSQKINYATAQAKARIGSFGIKVWLFY